MNSGVARARPRFMQRWAYNSASTTPCPVRMERCTGINDCDAAPLLQEPSRRAQSALPSAPSVVSLSDRPQGLYELDGPI